MNFDLDSLAASKQTTYRLVVGHNPGDNPEEVGFVIVGPNSEEYDRASREAAIEGIQAAEKRRDQPPAEPGSRESAEQLIERTDSSNRMVIRHCTVDWFGFRRNGELVQFSQNDLDALLKSRPNWRVRILRAIEDSGNFGEG